MILDDIIECYFVTNFEDLKMKVFDRSVTMNQYFDECNLKYRAFAVDNSILIWISDIFLVSNTFYLDHQKNKISKFTSFLYMKEDKLYYVPANVRDNIKRIIDLNGDIKKNLDDTLYLLEMKKMLFYDDIKNSDFCYKVIHI